jgi:uncharacterized protein
MTDSNLHDLSTELSTLFSIQRSQAQWIIDQIDQGATVPFLARYRKEHTGSLDEAKLYDFFSSLEILQTREKRRNSILNELNKQQVLTDQLEKLIHSANTILQLEDLYEPFKPRKQTLADKAREQGLGPLAEKALAHYDSVLDLDDSQRAGVTEILAERICFSPQVKEQLRNLSLHEGRIHVTKPRGTDKRIVAAQNESSKDQKTSSGNRGYRFQLYEQFFNSVHPIKTIPSHRILALFRGKTEKWLSLSLELPEQRVNGILGRALEQLISCSWSRLLSSSSIGFWVGVIERAYQGFLLGQIETWCFQQLKDRADADSIHLFAENLRSMVEQLPAVPARIMAIDPGFASGCKYVVLDSDGTFLNHGNFYFFRSGNAETQKKEIYHCSEVCKSWSIEKIVIGNGTAGRETLELVSSHISVPAILGDERGASVYSASPSARREFPDLDLTFRGAISIGRRYLNPMNELVKIAPESLGVGQYQHDIDQKKLTSALEQIVSIAVNTRGVELNSAGPEILQYVSGLKPKVIDAILSYRKSKGRFTSRNQLLEVKGLGGSIFQQCAGFLTIDEPVNPLDSTPIHPELYNEIESLETYSKQPLSKLIGKDLEVVLDKMVLHAWKKEVLKATGSHDEPTWVLIRQAFKDYKKKRYAQEFAFSPDVHSLEDLKPGMVLPGKITNITAFGAFTDLGVHKDGLIHISQLSDQFVKDPLDVVSPGLWVQVEVLAVDPNQGKIQLRLVSHLNTSNKTTS